jgi:peptidyl-prolyl cis-trans isomerase C
MRIRSFVVLAVLLVSGLLLFGCGDRPSTAPADVPVETTEGPDETPAEAVASSDETTEDVADLPEDEVVAYVNGRPAMRSDFEAARLTLLNQYVQMYTQFGMSIQDLLAGGEGRLFQLSLEVEALRRVMAAELVEEEADRRGIQPSAEDVEAEFETQYLLFLAGQDWTAEDFIAYLEEQGTSFELFKETGLDTVEWQLTLDAVRRAVSGPVEPSEEDLAAYFEEHRAEYETEEQVQASHILLGTSDDELLAFLSEHEADYASEDTVPELEEIKDQLLADIRSKAGRIHAELSAGADFAELAREHSTGPSGPGGGDLGWFGRGSMVAPFEEAAFALEVGQISDIVETQFGFHIILLTGRREAFEPQLDDVRDQVGADLEEEILTERMQTWFDEVYEAANFEILLPLVNALLTHQEDRELGIAELERIRDEGSVDEPYLPYIIGTLYEARLADAQTEKTALESGGDDTPELVAQIEILDAQIAEYVAKALSEYRRALDAVGPDATIEAKIAELEAQLGGDSEEEPATETPAEEDGE